MASEPTTEKTEALRHLTGRGGVGLVMFFLARKKIDFALTPDRSPLGDIWVSVAGQKYGIEIKTSRDKLSWQVKASQIAKVDFYALVSMDKAQCFILTSEEMRASVAVSPCMYGDVHLVARSKFNDGTLNAWGKIDGISGGATPDVALRHRQTKNGAVRFHKKTVTKTLSDGTQKTYVYQPTRIVV